MRIDINNFLRRLLTHLIWCICLCVTSSTLLKFSMWRMWSKCQKRRTSSGSGPFIAPNGICTIKRQKRGQVIINSPGALATDHVGGAVADSPSLNLPVCWRRIFCPSTMFLLNYGTPLIPTPLDHHKSHKRHRNCTPLPLICIFTYFVLPL